MHIWYMYNALKFNFAIHAFKSVAPLNSTIANLHSNFPAADYRWLQNLGQLSEFAVSAFRCSRLVTHLTPAPTTIRSADMFQHCCQWHWKLRPLIHRRSNTSVEHVAMTAAMAAVSPHKSTALPSHQQCRYSKCFCCHQPLMCSIPWRVAQQANSLHPKSLYACVYMYICIAMNYWYIYVCICVCALVWVNLYDLS